MTRSQRDTSTTLTLDSLARLQLELIWQSEDTQHAERYLARMANLWRDCFPPGLKQELLGKAPGHTVELDYAPGQALVPEAPRQARKWIPYGYFRRDRLGLNGKHPKAGRFYPKGSLEHLAGIHPQNTFPFRVLQAGEEGMLVDMGHPLAPYPVRVRATVLEAALREGDVGGSCTDWRARITDRGPGMQAALNGRQADFSDPSDFSRQDESEDAIFYQTPRLVEHIDKQASGLLLKEYQAKLEPGDCILDLMSGYESHIPLDMGLDVTGLGMNSLEMENNPVLSRHVVHDLNAHPGLPFPEESFHAVLCSLSVEYMTRPAAVLREAARVLRPGGVMGVSFSHRWFPPKTISLWPQLHEFERMGFVLDKLRETGAFHGLETISIRNWWRPEEDRYYPSLTTSDPIFLVWARRS